MDSFEFGSPKPDFLHQIVGLKPITVISFLNNNPHLTTVPDRHMTTVATVVGVVGVARRK